MQICQNRVLAEKICHGIYLLSNIIKNQYTILEKYLYIRNFNTYSQKPTKLIDSLNLVLYPGSFNYKLLVC